VQPPNSEHIVQVLRHDKTCANQCNTSGYKSSAARLRNARRSDFQMPPQVSGERQHQQRRQRQTDGGQPIMGGIIARREQVRDDAVTPVVILREHPRAHGQRPEKRKKNQPEQDSQSRFAIKHVRRLARNQMPRNLSADLACHRHVRFAQCAPDDPGELSGALYRR